MIKLSKNSIDSILFNLPKFISTVKLVSTRYNIAMDGTLLYQLLERISNLLRAEERKVGSEAGLQTVHLQVLYYLSCCNNYSDTPAAVTDYLCATKGTVSQTIKVLESKNYLVKEVDLKDRRLVHLRLTEAGRDLLAQVIPPPLFTDALEAMPLEQSKSLEAKLMEFLIYLQRANHSHTFGECKTCNFFTHEQDGYRCGLTQESLIMSETSKICREHEFLQISDDQV